MLDELTSGCLARPIPLLQRQHEHLHVQGLHGLLGGGGLILAQRGKSEEGGEKKLPTKMPYSLTMHVRMACIRP